MGRPLARVWVLVGMVATVSARGQVARSDWPAPFERFGAADVVRLAFAGLASPPRVHQTAIWKGEGTPCLLVLFAKPDARWEIAQVALENGRLVLVARYEDPDTWDDAHGFDLAPYRLTKDRIAIGVRYQVMTAGGTVIRLALYLRSGSTFERVFEHAVRFQSMDDADNHWSAIVQVVPGQQPYNDLRVVTQGTQRTIRETWTWDAASKAYREVR